MCTRKNHSFLSWLCSFTDDLVLFMDTCQQFALFCARFIWLLHFNTDLVLDHFSPLPPLWWWEHFCPVRPLCEARGAISAPREWVVWWDLLAACAFRAPHTLAGFGALLGHVVVVVSIWGWWGCFLSSFHQCGILSLWLCYTYPLSLKQQQPRNQLSQEVCL